MHFSIQRPKTIRETYVSNLDSFRTKTRKLLQFYNFRQKDEIAGNTNRGKYGAEVAPIISQDSARNLVRILVGILGEGMTSM